MSEKPSPAYQLLMLVWASHKRGTSWRKINRSMQQALALAITAGLKFELDDFGTIYNTMKGHYWLGGDRHEIMFGTAVEHGNLSACRSYEAWLGRPPFLFDGKRLHVGSVFDWGTFKVRVTSFAHAGNSLVACTYKTGEALKESFEAGEVIRGYGEQVDRRFTITINVLRAVERKSKRANRRMREINSIVSDSKMRGPTFTYGDVTAWTEQQRKDALAWYKQGGFVSGEPPAFFPKVEVES